MRESLRLFGLVFVLTAICAVAGLTLAWVNSKTEPKIEAYQAAVEAESSKQVLPGADSFTEATDLMRRLKKNPATSNIEIVKTGFKNGVKVGWVCKVASPGYSSNIIMLVGIKNDGRLGQIIILDQKETPGLGTNVTEPEFIGQPTFKKALPGTELKVSKDGGSVQAVTGATISSRAVVRGINQALQIYRFQAAQK